MLKLLTCTIITLSAGITEEKKSDDDITTMAQFEDYMNRTHATCLGDDASTCPEPDRSVCLNDYCYKTCTSNSDCAERRFLCSSENLCKPRGCHPCINGPTYPTEEPDQDGFELDASGITTIDEWEEYLRKTDSYCPSGDVAECPRQKRRICLDGKCFKQCNIGDDTQCADGFICNYEGLCKPEGCRPCIRNSMLPTLATTAAPTPATTVSTETVPPEDLENVYEDITTEDEFDAYMKGTRRVCPGGDVLECPNPRNRICLAGKCFKKCSDDNDCADKFVCNFENLCKPEGCTPCRRATYYPTSQPPSDDVMAVIDGVKLEDEHQVFSTSMMVKLTSLVCVIIMIFWVCGGYMLWNNGDNKKIAKEPSTKYGSTATSSV